MPNQIDTRRMIPVKPALHARLKREAEQKGKTLNDYILYLLENLKPNS